MTELIGDKRICALCHCRTTPIENHNTTQGCPNCDCMATRHEAARATDEGLLFAMTEYTPTVEEVRGSYACWVGDPEWFDRMIAQVVRVAKVEALREAAQKFPNSSTWMIREWIRGEADRIEKEGS